MLESCNVNIVSKEPINPLTAKAVYIRPPFRASLYSWILMFLCVLLCLLFQTKSVALEISSKRHRVLRGYNFRYPNPTCSDLYRPDPTHIDFKPARLCP